MRTPIIAGNWKMYKTCDEAEPLVRELLPRVAASKAEIVVCPPFHALERVAKLVKGSNVKLGAQNAFWEDEGAFTGEIAPPMLAALGVAYCIVGHSERRQYFHEDDAMVNRRALALLKHGIRPIICVGERLEQREANQTLAVLDRQLQAGFDGLTAEQLVECILAYEPVWAIGTGRNATPEQAGEAHAHIRSRLRGWFGADAAERCRILYGGSVKPDNIAALVAQPDVDGALVGGASLDARAFSEIVHVAQRV